MTLIDDILVRLRARPGGMTDAELAHATGKLHQQINQRCRQMQAAGVIVRDRSGAVIVNRVAEAGVPVPQQPAAASALVSAAGRDWSWEGNVQAALCRWLVHEGWSLIQVVDTASKQQGTDVVAERAGSRMHVEVKGFPSTSYADPRRAGETKPTPPALQANHWYGAALLKALRLREKHPDECVAMAFPEAAQYRRLLGETQTAIRNMRIDVFLVAEKGLVTRW
ncbi:hypothetical protein ACFYL6_04565 [Micromonospora sp. NPDC007208]|uniref:hypothetical protein n=1 Tax=Micromonospora sp. NPDC007208 TaxID=3364236 RepID=UPI003685EE99